MDLKFVSYSYFEQLFQNVRPKLQYSKNRIFVTSHFGILLYAFSYENALVWIPKYRSRVASVHVCSIIDGASLLLLASKQ